MERQHRWRGDMPRSRCCVEGRAHDTHEGAHWFAPRRGARRLVQAPSKRTRVDLPTADVSHLIWPELPPPPGRPLVGRLRAGRDAAAAAPHHIAKGSRPHFCFEVHVRRAHARQRLSERRRAKSGAACVAHGNTTRATVVPRTSKRKAIPASLTAILRRPLRAHLDRLHGREERERCRTPHEPSAERRQPEAAVRRRR